MQAEIVMQTNPFAVLSLMVAPAILTNAASLLAMSTSNRLARAVDRGRELAKQLEGAADLNSPLAARRLNDLDATEHRAILLVASLQRFYIAMGGFALATFVSLLGATIAAMGQRIAVQVLEFAGIVAGLLAVGAMVHGSVLLIRETRIALGVMRKRVERVKTRAEFGGSGVSSGNGR
ncbi:MAG TPA: DUF2721 domain-containing protein [Lacipirellula sp.]